MEFYNKCAEILGTTYDCKEFPWKYRTRWNNRVPGSGRFPGFGLIRRFNQNLIHVALSYPVHHIKTYKSEKDVLTFLSSLDIT